MCLTLWRVLFMFGANFRGRRMKIAHPANLLRQRGLRPTRQRVAIAQLLFAGEDRHVTAEILMEEIKALGVKLSLATIYNSLHQFTAIGLLKEIRGLSDVTWFDTNVDSHHHFFDTESGALTDIPAEAITISTLPKTPPGKVVEGVDVIVRVSGR